MSRLLILLYGVASYFIGVIGLLSIIAVLAGYMSFGFLGKEPLIALPPIIWNVFLVAIWGVIHTGMARPGFKSWLTKIIIEPTERSTYVLVAGVTSVLLVGLWQAVPGQIWLFESKAIVYLIWSIFIFGWAFLFASTFAINHFDLFGLRQVYINFRNQDRPPLTFVKRAMYRYIRHPIQTGVLIGIWATPSMSATQFVLTLGFTIYIFVGLWFEERDLVNLHGDEYQQYKNETGKVLPKFG